MVESFIPNPEVSSLEIEVNEQCFKRRKDSEDLVGQNKSVNEMLEYFDNDYSKLADLYKQKVGSELVGNPFDSIEHTLEITKSCSIVIPTFNNSNRLKQCLLSIEASTFNKKYPQQLEVIVVDDGSTEEDISLAVQNFGLQDLNIKVFHQSNGRTAKAVYSGVLNASGDIVIRTDPDVVYPPEMIEEYMKRHEVLENVVFFGFRDSIDTEDPRLQEEAIENGSLEQLPFGFHNDGRVAEDGMSDSKWLIDGGNNQDLPIDIEKPKYHWKLNNIAWGLSSSASRKDLLQTFAAYDEGYAGYGGEDNDSVARLIALGDYVIPNLGGVAFHQNHPVRESDSREKNIETLKNNLNSALKSQDPGRPEQTDARLVFEKKNPREEKLDAKRTEKPSMHVQAMELFKMGLYIDAIKAIDEAEKSDPESEWIRHDKAIILLALGGKGHCRIAQEYLTKLVEEKPDNSYFKTSLAKVLSRVNHFNKAKELYMQVWDSDPQNSDLASLSNGPQANMDLGTKFLKAKKNREALKFLDAAIIGSSEELMPWALFNKGVALFNLESYDLALETLSRTSNLLENNEHVERIIANVYAKLGQPEKAQEHFTLALQFSSENLH
ncbi:MAG: glycosyltransferase [Patescibacteria group bacterium]|nr:glycosyltransferase [Patescibacteria group bacterium]